MLQGESWAVLHLIPGISQAGVDILGAELRFPGAREPA